MTPDRLISDTDWLSRQLMQLSNPAFSGMIHVEEHFVLNIWQCRSSAGPAIGYLQKNDDEYGFVGKGTPP